MGGIRWWSSEVMAQSSETKLFLEYFWTISSECCDPLFSLWIWQGQEEAFFQPSFHHETESILHSEAISIIKFNFVKWLVEFGREWFENTELGMAPVLPHTRIAVAILKSRAPCQRLHIATGSLRCMSLQLLQTRVCWHHVFLPRTAKRTWRAGIGTLPAYQGKCPLCTYVCKAL